MTIIEICVLGERSYSCKMHHSPLYIYIASIRLEMSVCVHYSSWMPILTLTVLHIRTCAKPAVLPYLCATAAYSAE